VCELAGEEWKRNFSSKLLNKITARFIIIEGFFPKRRHRNLWTNSFECLKYLPILIFAKKRCLFWTLTKMETWKFHKILKPGVEISTFFIFVVKFPKDKISCKNGSLLNAIFFLLLLDHFNFNHGPEKIYLQLLKHLLFLSISAWESLLTNPNNCNLFSVRWTFYG